MTAAAKSVPAIGFLTAVEHAEFGIFGGYLILNATGRPLEFHCTAPVKANRAQEILYGPTLREYFYEQIAPALLAKGKLTPVLVCTDSAVMLAAVQHADAPLVLIAADAAASGGSVQLALGRNQARLPLARAAQQAAIEQSWRQLHAGELDLSEPFARIREALEEAQRAAAMKAAA
jgi:hypothetical protein